MSGQLQPTKIEVLPADTSAMLPAKQPHRWQPGQSGNPSGRPAASYQISDLAKRHTPEALATLVQVMRDATAPHGARVNAAECLLNRAWGKPTMQIEAKVASGGLNTWDDWRAYWESPEYRATDEYKEITKTMDAAVQEEARRNGDEFWATRKWEERENERRDNRGKPDDDPLFK